MDRHLPERSVGFLLHEVSRLTRRRFNARLQPSGLTQEQWRALAHIARREGIGQAALADILEIQPITLTRVIDRLAGAGLVERRPNPNDRRAVQLFLTAQATPLIEHIAEHAAAVHREALADLPPAARETLIDILQAMKRNLARAEDAPAATGADNG